MSQPGPTQGSRRFIVGELLPWSLALAQPSVLRGADLPCPGPACGHKSTESASCQGGSCGKCFSRQPHLRPPPLGPLFRVAQPPAPSLQLPVSWAPHTRPGCLAAFQQAVQLPGIHGTGLDRHSQPVQAQALGPRIIEVLWF